MIEASIKEMWLVTTLTKTFPTERTARHAIAELRAAGVRARDIRLVIGRRPGDIRREPVGGFAGAVGPDAPVGTYAGGAVRRGRGTGTFAGDADRQRQGSFADTDRVVIVRSEGDRERAHITGLRGAARLLRRAGLDDDAVDRAVADLHRGRAVVLAELGDIDASQAEARIEQLARAA
jgi:hypothetical protein